MHRSHQNILPVANKYLEHFFYIKTRRVHQNNLKHMHGLLDQSPPLPRPHCIQRLKQKQMKEEHTMAIDQENERLQASMRQSRPYVDSHNHYVARSLNREKHHRELTRHHSEIIRLNADIAQARTNYSRQRFERDYAKQQDFQRRIARYPSEIKKQKKN